MDIPIPVLKAQAAPKTGLVTASIDTRQQRTKLPASHSKLTRRPVALRITKIAMISST
jgi:hypothetical protein